MNRSVVQLACTAAIGVLAADASTPPGIAGSGTKGADSHAPDSLAGNEKQ